MEKKMSEKDTGFEAIVVHLYRDENGRLVPGEFPPTEENAKRAHEACVEVTVTSLHKHEGVLTAGKLAAFAAASEPAYREMSAKMNAALAELASIKLATRYQSRHPFKIESEIAVTFGPKDSMTWNDTSEGEVSR